MELKDTIEMMNSEDPKQQFRAEYYQVVIRYKKLKSMLLKWDEGTLDFKPMCPRSIYDMQIEAMKNYIEILETRANIEHIVEL
mgnify:CR=1 FL=1